MFLTLESAKLFFSRFSGKANKNNGEEAQKNSSVAVLIIDMQDCFLEDMPRKKRERLIKNQIEVIHYCIKYDIPVIALEFKDRGKTIKQLSRLIENVPRREFVTKNLNNGFHNPELEDVLKLWEVKKLLLMGVNASACVLDTADGGNKKGFVIATSENLIADNIRSEILNGAGKKLSWYKKKGIYKKNHLELIKSLA